MIFSAALRQSRSITALTVALVLRGLLLRLQVIICWIAQFDKWSRVATQAPECLVCCSHWTHWINWQKPLYSSPERITGKISMMEFKVNATRVTHLMQCSSVYFAEGNHWYSTKAENTDVGLRQKKVQEI